jgi:hypothetical protein
MTSILFAATITGLVIAIGVLIEFCFSFFKILLKKPLSPKGAVEIDPNEHIYSHPDYTDQLQDHRLFGVQTTYEALLHGLKIAGDRPLFSFRQSSDQSFKSYSHK